MLLTVDVGNTNIKLGVFEDEVLQGTFRMTTKRQRTSDEFGADLCQILAYREIPRDKINAVIVASVVPDIMYAFTNGIQKYLDTRPLIVSAGIKTGISIVTEDPKEIGPDRIVDAVGGYELYGGPVIVIDYGTATTYDLVGPKGTFEAGITAPGIETSLQSLWGGAAMLPSVEIKRPKSILAKETISSMQAGLVYGTIGETEYIVQKIKEASGYVNAKVVATGGLGRMIAEATDRIDVYNAQLSLDGLRLIYNKNKR
ncbi:MAG: type III pantothenate kinase [Lachnospiraceae bacterium]|nr:type III pantothenate kinase [Lachnospiraceae bacterium]